MCLNGTIVAQRLVYQNIERYSIEQSGVLNTMYSKSIWFSNTKCNGFLDGDKILTCFSDLLTISNGHFRLGNYCDSYLIA